MNRLLLVYGIAMSLFGLAISFSPILAYYLAGREYVKKYSKPKKKAKMDPRFWKSLKPKTRTIKQAYVRDKHT